MTFASHLYTSYWRSPLLAEVEAEKVSISRGDAKFGLGFRYRKLWLLCPGKATFSLADAADFERAYLAGFEEAGVDRIDGLLRGLSVDAGGKPLILLCYERSPQECHRSMFARFWQEKTGQEVAELGSGMLPERSDVEQRRLF